MDPLTFILFFVVVVPLILINLHNIQKRQKEIIDLLKETNRLLANDKNNEKS